MSINVKCNCKELKALCTRLKREEEYIRMLSYVAKEIAMRLFAMVKNRTPVGVYPSGSGKTGGTLRRGWSVGRIKRRGNIYEVEVINNVEYASYVELGHRKRNNKGWVPGQYFLEISEQELQVLAPALVERILLRKLKEIFNA